jgi:ubiquinone/menaquinone biosynthesis C-methylase UbiE
MSTITEHFNEIAPRYDYFKRRNWYYYRNLKKLAGKFIPPDKTVLEIGTATGDILFSLRPSAGTGIDISPKMIELAREKYKNHPNLEFSTLPADQLERKAGFDYIVLTDVVEHAEDLSKLAGQIKNVSSPGTLIFISMANPLWEPIMALLEKLKLKMPEGEHHRAPAEDIIGIFRGKGLEIRSQGFSLILPAYIPLVSRFFNWLIPRTPLLKKLCLIQYMVFEPSKTACG